MSLRPTQSATYSQIRLGLLSNFAKLVRAQEQVATGKRILRMSDDPVGASQAIAFRHRIAASDRYKEATRNGRAMLDTAAVGLQDGVGLLTDAREMLLQGMNGTQSTADRRLLADQIELIRERMLSIANGKSGDRSLFGGTATTSQPFVESTVGGRAVVTYAGNDEPQELLIGFEERIQVGLPGSSVFARQDRTGTQYSGLTGAARGASADQGSGYDFLEIRHDSTSATIGAGIQLAFGGANDTLVGVHTVTVDAALGTVQLDNGVPVAIPAAGDPSIGDLPVLNEHGAELHLDFSAWSGTSTSAAVTGAGSISIDGTNWTPLDFLDTDLELVDAPSETVLHVDTTGIHRAGRELVTFGGTVNVFDVLQGIVDDLDNVDGLDDDDLLDRLNIWLGELDRNQESILSSTGALGARSQHLSRIEERLDDAASEVKSLLSSVEDADYSQVVLDMTRAEQTLQLAQATSVRLMQNSLLNFLR